MSNGKGNFATAQVSVDTTAGGTLLAARRDGRSAVTIINHGATPVFVGIKGLTGANGARLPGVEGASITIPTQGEVYGITTVGSQAVSVLESF